LMLLTVIATRAVPQTPATLKKEELSGNAAKAAEFAAAESVRYEIRHADPSQAVLKMVPEPVLRFSNPIVADVHGSLYLWTNNGCPEVAASIFQFFDRRQLNTELVSLTTVPLRADRNGRPRWTPDAGVQFAPLAGSAAPADTADRRQLQMRQLART